jgi:hypothetical protein
VTKALTSALSEPFPAGLELLLTMFLGLSAATVHFVNWLKATMPASLALLLSMQISTEFCRQNSLKTPLLHPFILPV